MKLKIYLIIIGILIIVGVGIYLVKPEFSNIINLVNGKSFGVMAEGGINDISIDYKNNNMTIEFKDKDLVIGKSTLKSHKTYDEVLKVTSGKDKVVIWYEFSDFQDVQLDSLKSVEFIDMRKEIANESLLKEGGFIEKDVLNILNPNYLLPIEKNYSFVYLDEKGNWLDYNLKEIPKGNITIGVQTDLFWGEFIDVRLNVLNNKLDRHALVLGTNAGFVTTAPIDDPVAGNTIASDTQARALKVIAPAGAIKVTEIGWWASSATEAANTDVGLYDHNGADNNPENRLGVTTFAKGTTEGWKKATGLNIAITEGETYWIAVQVDDTATPTPIDYIYLGAGQKHDYKNSQTSLPNPWGTNSGTSAWVIAIYAVYETAPAEDTTPPTYSSVNHNTTIAGANVNFSILYNDDIALHPNGQWIFSTNNTGVWINSSLTNFTATPQTITNITKLDSTPKTIGYRWFAKDNAGNVNNTPIYNLIITSADTCTYTSGNWNVNCADYCNITTNVDGGKIGNNFTASGSGWFKMSANISGFKNYRFSNGCNATCKGGCIRI